MLKWTLTFAQVFMLTRPIIMINLIDFGILKNSFDEFGNLEYNLTILYEL